MDGVSLCAALGRNTTVFSNGIQVVFPLMPPHGDKVAAAKATSKPAESGKGSPAAGKAQ